MEEFDFSCLDRLDRRLAEYADECRDYIDIVPAHSIIQAGNFCECLADCLWKKRKRSVSVAAAYHLSQGDRIKRLEEHGIIPGDVAALFLRAAKLRNKHAHSGKTTPEQVQKDAHELWKIVVELGSWTYGKFCREEHRKVERSSSSHQKTSSSRQGSGFWGMAGIALFCLLYILGTGWCFRIGYSWIGAGLILLPVAGAGVRYAPTGAFSFSRLCGALRGVDAWRAACFGSLFVLTMGAAAWSWKHFDSSLAGAVFALPPALLAALGQYRLFRVKQLIAVYLTELACLLLVEYCFFRYGVWGGLLTVPLLPGSYFAMKDFFHGRPADAIVSLGLAGLVSCIVAVVACVWNFGLANGIFVLGMLLACSGGTYFSYKNFRGKSFYIALAVLGFLALLILCFALNYGVWAATKAGVLFLSFLPAAYFVLKREMEKALILCGLLLAAAMVIGFMHSIFIHSAGLPGSLALILAVAVTAAGAILAYFFIRK